MEILKRQSRKLNTEHVLRSLESRHAVGEARVQQGEHIVGHHAQVWQHADAQGETTIHRAKRVRSPVDKTGEKTKTISRPSLVNMRIGAKSSQVLR